MLTWGYIVAYEGFNVSYEKLKLYDPTMGVEMAAPGMDVVNTLRPQTQVHYDSGYGYALEASVSYMMNSEAGFDEQVGFQDAHLL